MPAAYARDFALVTALAHLGFAVALLGTDWRSWSDERYVVLFGVVPRGGWAAVCLGVVALMALGVWRDWARRGAYILAGAMWATGAAAFSAAWLGGDAGAALGTITLWLLAALLFVCGSLPRAA